MTTRRLRVIDYVANPGGGVRFVVEALRALLDRADLAIELVSHGEALARYRQLLDLENRVRLLSLPPVAAWRSRTWAQGIPGAGPLNWALGTGRFHFEVPEEALDQCDVAWLPWLHRHRIRWQLSGMVVASLHDLILLDFPGIVPAQHQRDERETVRQWVASSALIVASSHATVSALHRHFAAPPTRCHVVPLSGHHLTNPSAPPRASWSFFGRPYLLTPANTARHKNHDVLMAGVGAWGAAHPLVLTGGGTDVWRWPSRLARAARRARLELNESLFGLGYVDDAEYYTLLNQAWVLVMPTLAEGGGSFPVLEAMLRGIPVIASDIPVMREMVTRLGGQVIWFNPTSPASLTAALEDLYRDYDRLKAEAMAQVRTLRSRTWADVAADYSHIMRLC